MQKKFWESKACWAAILLVVAGLAKAGAEYLSTGTVDWQSLVAVFGGLGVFGLRDAMK